MARMPEPVDPDVEPAPYDPDTTVDGTEPAPSQPTDG